MVKTGWLPGPVAITFTAPYQIWVLPNPCGKKTRRCRPCGGRIESGSEWYYAYRIYDDGKKATVPEFPVCRSCVVKWGLKW